MAKGHQPGAARAIVAGFGGSGRHGATLCGSGRGRSILEVVVRAVAGPLRRGAALEELRGMLRCRRAAPAAARSAGSRPILRCSSTRSMNWSACRRRSSATIGGRVESVEMTMTRLPGLDSVDQRAEIAVTGEQHHLIDIPSELHDVDRELDIHVALDLAAPHEVGEFLGGLGHHLVAVVIEPIDQGLDRRIFGVIEKGGVVEGADQATSVCRKKPRSRL